MTQVLPAAKPVHTAIVCVLLFGGALVVQIAAARAPKPDPWAGLANASERARAVVDAVRPCEQALEDANGARRAGSESVKQAPSVCAAARAAVDAAGLPEPCRAAAASAADAAGALARGEDAGRDIGRYRASRTKCLAEAAA